MNNKPTYSDDRQLFLTAYIGPRRMGKRNFNGKYGANPKDPKEGYPSFLTDEVFELYKAAGLNVLLPEADAWYGTRMTEDGYVLETEFEKSDLYHYMKVAEANGLVVYPTLEELFGPMTHQDGPFGKKEKTLIRDFVKTVQAYFPTVFKGIMLTDEPTCRSLGRVKKIVDYLYSEEIRAIKPDMDLFASMLPIYADINCFAAESDTMMIGAQVGFGEERTQAYQSYMNTCFEITHEFSYDYYGIGRDGWLSPAFYHNLQLAATVGKEKNYPISITLLSARMDTDYNPNTGRGKTIFREPTYEDMCYQVYSALAFGVSRIGYFTFWQHYNEGTKEVFPKAMVNYDPSREEGYRATEIYYAVKEVNEEINAIDHIFMRFRWEGCTTFCNSRDRNIRLLKTDYEDTYLKKIKGSRDTLVGCFKNPEDGARGYWIVNAHNPYRHEMNDVEVWFKGVTNLVYYRKGREYDVSLVQDTVDGDIYGKWSVRLGVGEGIFVIAYDVYE